MRRGLALLTVAAVLSACSNDPNAPAVPAPSAAVQAPDASAPARPFTPIPHQASGDACGAAGLQRLVGRPRLEIPIPVEPDRQRVACTTCPVTQDYDPRRLNIFFDADSGIIRQVRCG